MDYNFHEVANIFRMMTPDEYKGLKADIKANGQLEPIWLHPQDNTIIDGRNRYKACIDLGIKPKFKTWSGDGSLVEFVISLNLHRRHLESSQAAASANLALPLIEAEKAQVQKAAGAAGAEYGKEGGRGNKKKPLEANLPQGVSKSEVQRAPQARDIVAKMFNVSPRYVQEAKRIKEKKPELFEAVLSGKVNIPQAKSLIQDEEKAKTRKKLEAQPEIKQEVFLDYNVKLGDAWLLGRHLVFCGDTSSPEFVKIVEKYKQDSGRLAGLCFADPPYNQNVASWDNNFIWRHDWLLNYSNVVAVTPGISELKKFMKATTMNYKWSCSCVIDNGMTRGAMGFGNWVYCALFSNSSSIHKQSQDIYKTSIKSNDIRPDHRGRKPPAFIAWLINLYSATEGWIIDPFLGSGTTLYECEKLNRVCIGGEINPSYVKAVIETWAKITGLEAVRIG